MVEYIGFLLVYPTRYTFPAFNRPRSLTPQRQYTVGPLMRTTSDLTFP